MPDDVLLHKTATMERCLKRVREEYLGHKKEFSVNFTVQDSVILNLLRACEASIDAAMHVVRIRRLSIPQDSRDAFSLLERVNVLPPELSRHMQAMVGFRNIAVHDYQKLNLSIVEAILNQRLPDFEKFCGILVVLSGE